MRVLIVGASGFVGGWLVRDLEAAGHQPVEAPPSSTLDLGSPDSAVPLRRLVDETAPDAVAHLASVSYAPDARADPARAEAVAIGGSRRLFEALAAAGSDAPVLVAGSSEVYAVPGPADLPLTEASPLVSDVDASPYARSKLGQEQVAAIARGAGRRVVVSRAFNHTGPGQREVFVAPALAQRVLAVRAGEAATIRIGNADVRRDIGDVRDVVRAYRLLLEALVDGAAVPPVVNVATGRSVSIREVATLLCAAAGLADTPLEVDPALVRPDEAAEIVGSPELLASFTGWAPSIPLETTLRDLLASFADASSTPPRR